MRKLVLAVFFLALAAPVLGLQFSISDSCGQNEEVLFSISNRTNAHAAEPGYYKDFTGPYNQDGKQVCAQGIQNVRIAQQCDALANPVLSFYDPGSGVSHLSPKDTRNEYVLCAEQLATSVWRSCPGTTEPIVSIYSPTQAHVAVPGHYEWQICGGLFHNATVAYRFTLSGNTDFIANFRTGVNTTVETTTDRPGYVAVQNQSLITGLVGGGPLPHRVGITNRSGRAVLNHTMTDRGQWFLPLTEGTYFDIEARLDMIESGRFLDAVNPNFAYTIAEEVLIRVTVAFTSIDIVNSLSLGPGVHNLVITNLGTNDQGQTQVSINQTINQTP